jgi:hypothetical protein
MKTLLELKPLIIEWAKDRNILFPENAPKQRLKLIEECGELASAILKSDVKLQKDAIGDVFFVLVILAEQEKDFITDFELKIDLDEFKDISYNLNGLIDSTFRESCQWGFFALIVNSFALNLDITECANIAWNEIKDRKGKTVNGTFIKN